MRVFAVDARWGLDEVMIMNPDHNPAPAQPRAGRTATKVDQLHICVLCSGGLVQPFDWEAEGPLQWRVVLHCPDCHGVREGIFTQTAVDALADELDRGSGILIRELDRLTHENMAAEIEVLVEALESDLIMPCDF